MTSINIMVESYANEDSASKSNMHKDLGPTRMKRDAEAVALVGQWFDTHKPFDVARDSSLLVSFATGFTSSVGVDSVNAEKAMEVGEQMNKVLDNKSYDTSMEVKSKVKPLSTLRKAPVLDGEKIYAYPLEFFNRLIIII